MIHPIAPFYALMLLAVAPHSPDPARPWAGSSGEPCSTAGASPSSGSMAGLAQPPSAPDELLALIEIPAGSAVKYELDEASGRMEVDRFLSMPVAYPANYGFLPCTHAEDGDPLDVVVLTRFPIAPGAIIRVRPIGVLRMIDRGEQDDKVLAVPIDTVDPTYAQIRTAGDLPAAELDRIEAFFRVYKQLPAPATSVEVGPWEGAESAALIIRATLEAEARR